jgi:hypothetical protein
MRFQLSIDGRRATLRQTLIIDGFPYRVGIVLDHRLLTVRARRIVAARVTFPRTYWMSPARFNVPAATLVAVLPRGAASFLAPPIC